MHGNANLRSIQKGLGKEQKIDPASSASSSKKGLKDNKGLLSIVNKFCIPLGTEIKISICGVLDSDCTEVTLHRVANFRAKQFNSDIEQTRRGIILLLFKLPLLLIHYLFSVKNIVSIPVFRVKVVIF